MYTTFASIAVTSAALLSTAAACDFTERATAVLHATNDVLRIPLSATGEDGQTECAATAEAFGYTTASTTSSDCIVYDDASDEDCLQYELLEAAVTMSNITACDDTTVETIAGAAMALAGAGAQETVGTATTATKITNTAAVGMAVHSDLSFPSEEECLVTCALYLDGCTHVSTVATTGELVKCSFHGSPTQGVELQGGSVYYDITPSPALASLTLGLLSSELGTGVTPVAATPTAATVEPDTPTTVAGAAPVPAVVTPIASTPTAAAPASASTLETLLYSEPGVCPAGGRITQVPSAEHYDSLPIGGLTEEAQEFYADVLDETGEFPMTYGEIVVGGTYCVEKGSTNPTVTVGGMFFFEVDDECVVPPLTDDGESCCEVYMWQPSNDGLYYDNCSMRLQIPPDGLYYFHTEMPGDESVAGWGPDPEPHIHFDVICTGCADNDAFEGSEYQYWNKFYPEDICTIDGCGVQGAEHQATQLEAAGQTIYKYDFLLPGETRDDNGAEPPVEEEEEEEK